MQSFRMSSPVSDMIRGSRNDGTAPQQIPINETDGRTDSEGGELFRRWPHVGATTGHIRDCRSFSGFPGDLVDNR